MLKKKLGVRPDIQASYERLHIHLFNEYLLSSCPATILGLQVQQGTKQCLKPLFKWEQNR